MSPRRATTPMSMTSSSAFEFDTAMGTSLRDAESALSEELRGENNRTVRGRVQGGRFTESHRLEGEWSKPIRLITTAATKPQAPRVNEDCEDVRGGSCHH